MPEPYGAGGGRLVLPITVRIDSREERDDDDPFVGPGASLVLPQGTGRYVSLDGERTVRFASSGGWTLEFPRGRKGGEATRLRWWMDLETSIRRNDIEIDLEDGRGGEILFLCQRLAGTGLREGDRADAASLRRG